MIEAPFRAAFAIAAAATLASHASAQLEHRQANLTVRVENLSGAPLPGAVVKVEMLNHAFRFGTAVAAGKLERGTGAYDATTVENLEKYFNSITYENEMKWAPWESRTPAQRRLDLVRNAFTYKAFGSSDPMRLRGHATVWGSQYSVPGDVQSMTNPATIRARILGHVEAYHAALKDEGIDNFDLYNEPFHERAFIMDKLVGPNPTVAAEAAEIAAWFKKAKEIDPDAKLFFNEYNILNFWTEQDEDVHEYKALVDAVRDAGGPVDGIGLQGHMDRLRSKAQIKRRLDILSAPMAPTANYPDGLPGLAIEVTELDIHIAVGGWGGVVPSDELQAEAFKNVLEGAFEHPAVQGVTIWVMNTGSHWRQNAPIFDVNWNIRPSGHVWIDRVRGTWWTNETGASGFAGAFETPVFKGTHKITVTFNGETQELVQDLTADQTLTFEFDYILDPSEATTYEGWAAAQTWEAEGDEASDADPDEDGRSNFEEFVYGTDPFSADSAPNPWQFAAGGAAPTLSFSIRAANGGLGVVVKKSTDLETWTDIPLAEAATLVETEDGVSTFAIKPAHVATRAFFQIHVPAPDA